MTEPWGATSVGSHIFHNTFYQNYRALYANTAESLTDVIVKNNIFYDSVEYEIQWDVQGETNDSFFINNIIEGSILSYYPVGTQTLTYLETNYPTYWYGNIEADPVFMNATGGDFTLQSGSPCIDAGDWLTTITSENGSGASFVVTDAGYFCDGFGISTGDTIQLEGQNTTRTITAINYETNTITVNESVSWTQGDGVALAYSGSAPDMGAYEYVSSEKIALRLERIN